MQDTLEAGGDSSAASQDYRMVANTRYVSQPGNFAACFTHFAILRLIEIVLLDMNVTRVLVLAGDGRHRSQRRAAEEGDL